MNWSILSIKGNIMGRKKVETKESQKERVEGFLAHYLEVIRRYKMVLEPIDNFPGEFTFREIDPNGDIHFTYELPSDDPDEYDGIMMCDVVATFKEKNTKRIVR